MTPCIDNGGLHDLYAICKWCSKDLTLCWIPGKESWLSITEDIFLGKKSSGKSGVLDSSSALTSRNSLTLSGLLFPFLELKRVKSDNF
jgi:hypothetical protein